MIRHVTSDADNSTRHVAFADPGAVGRWEELKASYDKLGHKRCFEVAAPPSQPARAERAVPSRQRSTEGKKKEHSARDHSRSERLLEPASEGHVTISSGPTGHVTESSARGEKLVPYCHTVILDCGVAGEPDFEGRAVSQHGNPTSCQSFTCDANPRCKVT